MSGPLAAYQFTFTAGVTGDDCSVLYADLDGAFSAHYSVPCLGVGAFDLWVADDLNNRSENVRLEVIPSIADQPVTTSLVGP